MTLWREVRSPRHNFRVERVGEEGRECRGWTKYAVYRTAEVTVGGGGGADEVPFRPWFADPVPELPVDFAREADRDDFARNLEEFFVGLDWRVEGRRLVFPEDYFWRAGELGARLTRGKPATVRVYLERADLSVLPLGRLEWRGGGPLELILTVQEECPPAEPPLRRALRKLQQHLRPDRRLVVQEVYLTRRGVIGRPFNGDHFPVSAAPTITWLKTSDSPA